MSKSYPARIAILSDTMYVLISFRKSIPQQNRQLQILNSSSKQLTISWESWLPKTNQ